MYDDCRVRLEIKYSPTTPPTSPLDGNNINFVETNAEFLDPVKILSNCSNIQMYYTKTSITLTVATVAALELFVRVNRSGDTVFISVLGTVAYLVNRLNGWFQ